MTITSGFFNSDDGDRKYNAEDFNNVWSGLATDGVLPTLGSKFAVTAGYGNMTIKVGTGKAWYFDTWLVNDREITFTIEDADLVNERYDYVVLDFNMAARDHTISVLTGAPASTPEFPALIDTATRKQIPIAWIHVYAGSEELTQWNVNDLVGTGQCPVATGLLTQYEYDVSVSGMAASSLSLAATGPGGIFYCIDPHMDYKYAILSAGTSDAEIVYITNVDSDEYWGNFDGAHVSGAAVVFIDTVDVLVDWWGVIPDPLGDGGIGNSSPQINKAISEVAKYGGIVRFAEGDYTVDAVENTICIKMESNVSLVGAGMQVTRILLNAQTDPPVYTWARPINVTDVENILISDMTIDGRVDNHASGSSEQRGNIFISGGEDVIVQRVHTTGSDGDGITIRGSTTRPAQRVKVFASYFGDCRRNGLTLGSNGYSGIHVDHCYFSADVDTQQIDSEPTSDSFHGDVVVSNCIFEEMAGDDDEYAITIVGSALASLENFVVTNCVIKNGLLIRRAKNVRITGCEIHSNNSYNPAISIDRDTSEVTISANGIRYTGNGTGRGAFDIKPVVGEGEPSNIKIHNNDIYSKYTDGMYIIGFKDLSIIGNTFRGENLGDEYAINLYAYSADAVGTIISNNTIEDWEYGILLRRSAPYIFTELVITDNIFRSSDDLYTMDVAIYVSAAVTARIHDEQTVIANNVAGSNVTDITRPDGQQVFVIGGNSDRPIYSCYDSPEGDIVSSIGAMAIRRNSTQFAVLYLKEVGNNNNTGWRSI